MDEPSLLDYIKSKLIPWRYERLEIPAQPPKVDEASPAKVMVEAAPAGQVRPRPAPAAFAAQRRLALPLRSLAALVCALVAQSLFVPAPERDWFYGAAFLLLSFLLLAWAALANEIQLAAIQPESEKILSTQVNQGSLVIGAALAVAAFGLFIIRVIDGQEPAFSLLNIIVLGLALFFVVRGFWISPRPAVDWIKEEFKRFQPPPWNITIKGTALLGILAVGIAVFFRYYRLGEVPPEMNSDHAEKFLDILRVLAGQTSIFFPSNGGREALQFYLAAGLHQFFGLPLDYMLLKLVTSTAGFLALPFIYLIGKEIANWRVGLFAFLLAGTAYWPNVVARVGLRLPFYIFFTAALMYFLLHGLRQNSRNSMIVAGVFLGLGFYGYSADRILPLLVLMAVGLFMIHRQPKRRRSYALVSLVALIAVSVVIFLPLFSYILAQPQYFFERTFTRMGDWERPIGDSILLVFLRNTGRALAMFSWDAGVVWPISIPGYPALGIVAGGLLYIGFGLVLLSYLRKRNWVYLFLLLSIPVLLLPSILSLAFPEENPNLYRTGGAVIPVFLLAGLALDALVTSVQGRVSGRAGSWIALGLLIVLMGIHSLQEYSLVFNRYYASYRLSAWNSSEIGSVARDFIKTYKVLNNVWVVGFPNWVDTRLVANNAGFPGTDYELKFENIPNTRANVGPKLFILNPQDYESLAALQELYPEGWLQRYTSKVETKDFMLFIVLPKDGS
jgi:hypothetical protein